MKRLVDVACPECGHVTRDVWVASLDASAYPECAKCDVRVVRAWLSAPSITPLGTRPEFNTDISRPTKVDTRAIAAETMREVQDKWLRYGDEKIAEQHVSREINERAGLADAQGNLKPLPTPPPITFEKPSIAECAV